MPKNGLSYSRFVILAAAVVLLFLYFFEEFWGKIMASGLALFFLYFAYGLGSEDAYEEGYKTGRDEGVKEGIAWNKDTAIRTIFGNAYELGYKHAKVGWLRQFNAIPRKKTDKFNKREK